MKETFTSGEGLPPLEDVWTNGDYHEFICAAGADDAVDLYRMSVSDSMIEYVALRQSQIRQRTEQLQSAIELLRQSREATQRYYDILKRIGYIDDPESFDVDLLDALKALRSFMWAQGYADQTPAMAQADAAIAKAEAVRQ